LKDTVLKSEVWQGMSLIQKQNLTGARWVSFLMSFFAECSWGDYFSVHTWLALNFFKCFRKGNLERPYQHVLEDGKVERTIPPQALTIIQKTDDKKLSEGAQAGAQVVRNILGVDPIVVRGPLNPTHTFVDPSSPTFEKAYKAMQKGDVIRGGDNAGGSILADAFGYSGFVTALTKGLVLTTALALFLSSKVKELDIQCDSIGDVPIVHQSMVNFASRIDNRCDVRYIVMLKSLNDVHLDYKSRCLTSFRVGSHRLYVSKRVVPSGKKTEDILEKSEEELHTLVDRSSEGESFTYYGPAFGSTPFRSGRHLYKFGVPSSFRAIVSTQSGLSLYGAHVSKDGRSLNPVVTELHCVKTPDEWYETVIRANAWKNGYFLRSYRQYSPISNLLTPPTKGVKFTLRGDVYEAGETGESDTFDDYQSESEEDDYYNQPSGDGSEGEDSSTEGEDEEGEQETTAQYTSATTAQQTPVVSTPPQPLPVHGGLSTNGLFFPSPQIGTFVQVELPPVSSASTTSSASSASSSGTQADPGRDRAPKRSVPSRGRGGDGGEKGKREKGGKKEASVEGESVVEAGMF